jgi:hypothetical protein
MGHYTQISSQDRFDEAYEILEEQDNILVNNTS